jgi:hypothetical protein
MDIYIERGDLKRENVGATTTFFLTKTLMLASIYTPFHNEEGFVPYFIVKDR